MLRIIDMLKASADRKTATGLDPVAVDSSDAGTQSDHLQAEAEHARSPIAMTRDKVRADLGRMMRSFSVEPDNVSLYQDELIEAEYACALCQDVGRCRAWMARGCRDDAPRLFCPNAALMEEITPDPFWSMTAPGAWHADMRTSPLLRLLASKSAVLNETHANIDTKKLASFIDIASAIDVLIESWSPEPDALENLAEAACRSADLEVAIDSQFDREDGLGKDDFARILQVALCDSDLAKRLCRVHARLVQAA